MNRALLQPGGHDDTVIASDDRLQGRNEMRSGDRTFVSLLTGMEDDRQITDGISQPAQLGALLLVLALIALVYPAAAGSVGQPPKSSGWQSTEEIATTAEEFLRQKLGQADKRIALQAGWLDPRVQMPRCTQALTGFLRRGSKISGRTIVGVRCDGLSPWKMYLPVDVMVTESVLIADRTLPSGHVVTVDDVRIEERDVSGMTGGYLSDPQELVGQRLKHQLMAGRVITPAMLQADLMIRRGQSVTILVRNDSLNIRMSGKALTDGAANQRIKVENVASKRVVEGLVRSPEHVEVLVY